MSVKSAEQLTSGPIVAGSRQNSAPVDTVSTETIPADAIYIDTSREFDGKGEAGKTLEAKPFQIEAAQRDSFSVATALAETSRHTRQSPTASLLMKSAAQPDLDSSAANTSDPAVAELDSITAPANAAHGAKPLDSGVSPARDASAIVNQTVQPIIALAEMVARRETRSIRMRLHPEDLGEIEINISRDSAGRLSARVSTQHEAARQALNSELDALRSTLKDAGLNFERLDVQLQSNSGETNTNQHAPQQQQQQENLSHPTLAAPIQPLSTEQSDHQKTRLLTVRA